MAILYNHSISSSEGRLRREQPAQSPVPGESSSEQRGYPDGRL